MNYDCTGVILAGGQNKRLPGIKKTFREIRGRMIMEVIYSLFTELFDRVIIVTNDPPAFGHWDATIVSDIYPSRCSLAGIQAGLFYASTPWIFVSACDTPFLERRLAEYILSQVDPRVDVVVPETDAGLEPLCAMYSKRCLPLIEKNLQENIYKINQFFKMGRIKKITMDEIEAVDPGIDSFFNINTPEDLEKAWAIAAAKEEFDGYK